MILILRKQSESLWQTIKFGILQDSKRLRTYQVPQEADIHPVPK